MICKIQQYIDGRYSDKGYSWLILDRWLDGWTLGACGPSDGPGTQWWAWDPRNKPARWAPPHHFLSPDHHQLSNQSPVKTIHGRLPVLISCGAWKNLYQVQATIQELLLFWVDCWGNSLIRILVNGREANECAKVSKLKDLRTGQENWKPSRQDRTGWEGK